MFSEARRDDDMAVVDQRCALGTLGRPSDELVVFAVAHLQESKMHANEVNSPAISFC